MCCLFGIYDFNNILNQQQKIELVKTLSVYAEIGGRDATGIAYNNANNMVIEKAPVAASKINFIIDNNPKVIMGHTRFATQGDKLLNYNNHPFYSEKLNIALSHNGIIHNDKRLRAMNVVPPTHIETDSYVAVQLLENSDCLSFESIKYMTNMIEGSFCFSILDNLDNLYLIKGVNPLIIVKCNGFYIYSSQTVVILNTIHKLHLYVENSVKICDGDILKFSANGNITKDRFDTVWSYNIFDSFSDKPKISTDKYIELSKLSLSMGYDSSVVDILTDQKLNYNEIEYILKSNKLNKHSKSNSIQNDFIVNGGILS